MRVCIHRGAREVGGSCVELECDGQRLLLDLGRPLDADLEAHVPLPPVEGPTTGDPSLLGVVLSHGHPDHYGLIPAIHPSIPVFVGEATQRILRDAMVFSPIGADLPAAGHLQDRAPVRLGPFTVTPYLMDHSAFDAYALLVEAGGRRVLYSGDLRPHGRKAKLFQRLVNDPPADVDALLLEGTKVAPDGRDTGLTEREVEDKCVDLFDSTKGMVLACYSGQNIDRLVTLHRAAKRSRRSLVLDLYGAGIARATGRPQTIPQGDWDSLYVSVPLSQRIRVKQTGRFHRTSAVRRRRLFPEDLAGLASELVVTFRASMARELDAAGCLNGARALWSMWPGYLDHLSGVQLRRWLADRDIPMILLHSSGHATVPDLQQWATAVEARQVVPIHTHHPDLYAELFDNVRVRENGEWWEA
jgi:ribonuclease J